MAGAGNGAGHGDGDGDGDSDGMLTPKLTDSRRSVAWNMCNYFDICIMKEGKG